MKLTPITQATLNNTQIKNSELMSGVCTAILELYEKNNAQLPWIGYLCSEELSQDQFIGTCAYKSNPINDRVEIAYFTFPEFEGKGYATRMVAELIRITREQDKNIKVFAQTLPKQNASNHILKKCGFKFIGEIAHPDDGLVWEWEF